MATKDKQRNPSALLQQRNLSSANCFLEAMDPHFRAEHRACSAALLWHDMRKLINASTTHLVQQTLWSALDTHRSIFFVGDSMMQQQWLGALFALQLALSPDALLECPDLSRAYQDWGDMVYTANERLPTCARVRVQRAAAQSGQHDRQHTIGLCLLIAATRFGGQDGGHLTLASQVRRAAHRGPDQRRRARRISMRGPDNAFGQFLEK